MQPWSEAGWAEEEAWLLDDGWPHWSWDESEAYWGTSEWAAAAWQDGDSEDLQDYAGADVGAELNLEEGDGAEDDEALASQEQDAAALVAEANKALAEARAAVSRVRSARGYYPLGGKKGGGTPAAKGAKGNFGGKSKGKAGKQFGKTSSSGPGCLICGSGSHFYRDCPQRFKGGPGARALARPTGPSRSITSTSVPRTLPTTTSTTVPRTLPRTTSPSVPRTLPTTTST